MPRRNSARSTTRTRWRSPPSTADGLPNVRMVLLKGVDRRGFVFYTNEESAKGRELAASGKAALLFHWKSLRRQVRVRGSVREVSAAEADAYFNSRPRDSRIGAWASQQSRPLESRFALEKAVALYAAKYRDRRYPAAVPTGRAFGVDAPGVRILGRPALPACTTGWPLGAMAGAGEGAALSLINHQRRGPERRQPFFEEAGPFSILRRPCGAARQQERIGMAGKYFGTDGIRGRANGVITPELAMKVGQAAGLAFQRGDHRHRVVIGKDTRLSGYMIEYALVAGFTSVGMDVLLLGPVPTPAVAMLTRSMRADLGVMISASHNMFEDNGIKLFGPDGYKLSDEIEHAIEALIDKDISRKLSKSPDLGRARRVDDVRARYIEFAKRTLPRQHVLRGPAHRRRLRQRRRLQGRAGSLVGARSGSLHHRRRAGRLQHQPRCRLDRARGAGQEGARDARRYRHRTRRRRRPGADRRRARPRHRRRPADGGHRAELASRTAGSPSPASSRRSCPISAWSASSAGSACRSRARRSATVTCSSICASTASMSAASNPVTSSSRTSPRPATGCSRPCRSSAWSSRWAGR